MHKTNFDRFWHAHGEKIAITVVIASLMAGLFMLSLQRTMEKMDYPGPTLLWGYGDSETDCNNNIDDDSDGVTDCADAEDCADAVNCQ
jgi:hypothetical protein